MLFALILELLVRTGVPENSEKLNTFLVYFYRQRSSFGLGVGFDGPGNKGGPRLLSRPHLSVVTLTGGSSRSVPY
jgi:hypothetical protein